MSGESINEMFVFGTGLTIAVLLWMIAVFALGITILVKDDVKTVGWVLTIGIPILFIGYLIYWKQAGQYNYMAEKGFAPLGQYSQVMNQAQQYAQPVQPYQPPMQQYAQPMQPMQQYQ